MKDCRSVDRSLSIYLSANSTSPSPETLRINNSYEEEDLSQLKKELGLVTDYNLTERQMRNIIKRCIENVNGLLDSADRLHTDERTLQYALGLYMYAVEEYGKVHLLKSRLVG
jgi:hypothetical protein